MAKFNVIRDTHVSHLGRTVKAGEVVEFDPPFIADRDVHGRVIMQDGKPKGKPMTIGSNLELIVEEVKAPEKKAEKA